MLSEHSFCRGQDHETGMGFFIIGYSAEQIQKHKLIEEPVRLYGLFESGEEKSIDIKRLADTTDVSYDDLPIKVKDWIEKNRQRLRRTCGG